MLSLRRTLVRSVILLSIFEPQSHKGMEEHGPSHHCSLMQPGWFEVNKKTHHRRKRHLHKQAPVRCSLSCGRGSGRGLRKSNKNLFAMMTPLACHCDEGAIFAYCFRKRWPAVIHFTTFIFMQCKDPSYLGM